MEPPGLYVWGTGPQVANSGSDITYAIHYKNNGSTTSDGTTVTFVTPPNTTFRSVSLPLACTAPLPGAAGSVVCDMGAQVPGTSGALQIVVTVSPSATGIITAGTYQIEAAGFAALIGPKINTAITSSMTYADVSVSVANGVAAVNWGAATSYTIRVANAGPSAVSNVILTDALPAQLTGVAWTCTAIGGGTCTPSGAGNLDESMTLPVGAVATYMVGANVVAGSGAGTLRNTVSVALPADVNDPDTSNNNAVDIDDIGPTHSLTLNKQGVAGGSVISTPAAIRCGTGCTSSSGQFLSGSTVILHALPVPYATFDGWAGACTGTSTTCTVTMSADQTVTANFTPSLTVSVSAGSGQAAPLSGAFAQPLVAIVRDKMGAPLSGTSVTFYPATQGASAVLTTASAVSDAQGLARVSLSANAVSGSYSVTAMISGSVAPAVFALSNYGPPASIGFYSGTPQASAPSAAFEVPLVAIVRDVNQTPVAGATVTFAAPSDEATANIPASVISDGLGLASVSATASGFVGSYTVTASVSGVAGSASFALSNGPCNGNNASAASGRCPAALPFCTDDGSCAAQCQRDSDCAADSWCNTGSCVAKLNNGVALPTLPDHDPIVNGVCDGPSSAAALAICASGVCDSATSLCGLGLDASGCERDDQCSAGVCVSDGPNAGSCRTCNSDTQCSGETPACDTASSACVACTSSNTSQCAGVCDPSSDSCVPCAADHTPGEDLSCPPSVPYCTAQGSCDKCVRNDDCSAGHAGPICHLASGACSTTCASDADCADGYCDVTSSVCATGCASDANCRAGESCDEGTCVAPQPDAGVVPDAGGAHHGGGGGGGGCSVTEAAGDDSSGWCTLAALSLFALIGKRRRSVFSGPRHSIVA